MRLSGGVNKNIMTNKRFTGIEQNFRIYREDKDEEITDLLGNLSNISYAIQVDNELRSDVNDTRLRQAVDGAAEIYVSVDCEPVSLKALQLVGEYEENEEEWTVQLTEYLPEMRAEIQVTNDHTLVISGIKFDGFTLQIQVDGVVEVTFNDGSNGNATHVELKEESLDFDSDQVDKAESFLDVTALINDNVIGSAESVSVDYTRNVDSKRGIQEYEQGERRLPDEITEGTRTFSWDATIEVTDATPFEVLFNQDEYPITLDDHSQDIDFTTKLTEERGSIELQDGKVTDLTGDIPNDDEVNTIDLSGNGIKAEITGELE